MSYRPSSLTTHSRTKNFRSQKTDIRKPLQRKYFSPVNPILSQQLVCPSRKGSEREFYSSVWKMDLHEYLLSKHLATEVFMVIAKWNNLNARLSLEKALDCLFCQNQHSVYAQLNHLSKTGKSVMTKLLLKLNSEGHISSLRLRQYLAILKLS